MKINCFRETVNFIEGDKAGFSNSGHRKKK